MPDKPLKNAGPRPKNLTWCLPRPRKDKYPGGFPLHFERRLLELLGVRTHGSQILHPFGGKAEYGIRLDVNLEAQPDIIADAHYLPFRNAVFDLVILDPPYSDSLGQKLYSSRPVHFKKYIAEAARVLKPGGYLVMYHVYSMPGAPGTHLKIRLLIETRVNHLARIVHIRQKDNYSQPALLGAPRES